ncbi:MAG: AMP-binding protein [Alphaproteobacteria bacterium]|jgi:phenylacetate-CoA ligase|nr:AMP-binding protein [Alphaproteobacteria bacterium]
MTGYFDAFDHRQMLADYPVGPAFLAETGKLSRDALRALQEARFAEVLARAWQVPFYQRLWGEAGIAPGDIRGLDDLGRLPTFSKTELMASIEAAPPFGDYHGIDDAHRNVVLHTTSGTTGAPQPIFFGAYDREMQNLLLARAYLFQGLRPEDVVHAVYGFGMVNGGHYIREAVVHFTDCLLLPAGTGLETRSEQQIELMRRFRATVLAGFVDYIKRLAEVAREMGVDPAADLAVRMITGHIGQEDRGLVSASWGGAEIFDWYGVGDTGIIAAEGPDHDGLYLFEDAHVVEILDPDSHAPVPEGEAGNICITVLFKKTIYPIIRFDTNDVTSVLAGSGGLGLNLKRIAGFQGRSDNMVKLRGINVYPTAIGAHLAGHEALTGEYVCRLRRHGSREEMTVVVEAKSGPSASPALQDEVSDLLRRRLGVEVGVALVGPGETAALSEIERRQKPIRLIDERDS